MSINYLEVNAKKWLTTEQAQELRKRIYTACPHLDRNVQIITVAAKVKVSGVRGYRMSEADAITVTGIVDGFETTPQSERDAALMNYLRMVAVSGYKAPSKRSRSLRGAR